jgi:hypothetical protein
MICARAAAMIFHKLHAGSAALDPACAVTGFYTVGRVKERSDVPANQPPIHCSHVEE